LDLQRIARNLLDALCDAPAMHWLSRNDSQDEQVKHSL